MAEPSLKVTAPAHKPFTVTISRSRLTLGRLPSNDIALPDKLVSGRHAEIYLVSGQLRIRDLGSTNGLYVNGIRRFEGVLRSGDQVRLGNCLIDVALPAQLGVEEERTDQTVIDPFSIKLSLDQVADELAEMPTEQGPVAALARQKLLLLYRLGQDVNCIENMDVWLERVSRLVREAVGPERLSILAFDAPQTEPGSRLPHAIIARDWTVPDPDCPVYAPPSFLREVMKEQKAILYQDTRYEPQFRKDPEVVRIPIRMVMAAPLVTTKGVHGVLYLDRTSSEPAFTPDDLHLLGVVANQCSVMLENVRLFAAERSALEELKRTQEQLIQAAKLSSLGELVAGVAHEINNPLSAVLGFAQLLLADPAVAGEMRGDVKKIVEQALRVKRIVEKLLIFARRGGRPFEPVSLKQVLESALEFKAYDFRAHKVVVERSIDPTIPPISADRHELEQVLINILHNADQAMAPLGGGTLRVATHARGGDVEVEVADSGPGIPTDILPKIFDPFFTTKPPGEGTGLGLSVSHGIVERHGGRIHVANRPEGGATFTIALPARPIEDEADAAAAAARAAAEAAADAGPPERRLRVLVLEDEEPIREVAGTYLRNRGCNVTLAADGREALEALGRGERFDVLVADIRLPRESGIAVYEEAIKLDPALEGRVVFITGDVANPEHAGLETRFPGAILAKPFHLDELERRLRRLVS